MVTIDPTSFVISDLSVVHYVDQWHHKVVLAVTGTAIIVDVLSAEEGENQVTDEKVRDSSRYLHDTLLQNCPSGQVPPYGPWVEDLARKILSAFEEADASRKREMLDLSMRVLREALHEAVENGVSADEMIGMVREAVVRNVIES